MAPIDNLLETENELRDFSLTLIVFLLSANKSDKAEKTGEPKKPKTTGNKQQSSVTVHFNIVLLEF